MSTCLVLHWMVTHFNKTAEKKAQTNAKHVMNFECRWWNKISTSHNVNDWKNGWMQMKWVVGREERLLFLTWHIIVMVQHTAYALELKRVCIERVLKWELFWNWILLRLPGICQFHCRLQTNSNNVRCLSNLSQCNLIDFVDGGKMRGKGWF